MPGPKHQVEKRYATSLLGGPGGRQRRECWGATIDGVWEAYRIDDVGTPWGLRHIPTDTIVPATYGRQVDGKLVWFAHEHVEATWGSLAKVIRAIDLGHAADALRIVGVDLDACPIQPGSEAIVG